MDYIKRDKNKKLKEDLIKILIFLLVFLIFILGYIVYQDIQISNENISNENIEKSVLIYNKLNENIEKNIFENAIKGKTVAVIGNGPQEIGKGCGEEIDSHDIIIRFNNFNIKGFEKDYGSKTDIWVRGFQASKYEKGINRDYNIMYCYEGDLNCTLLGDDIIEELYNDISNNNWKRKNTKIF